MLNKDSWRRCKTAVPGKVPDMKWTRGAGDLVESFKRDWSKVDIYVGERTRLAKPDISTGVPYNDRILSDAAGLDLLLLARPQDIMEPNAFLKDENLWRRLGRFPSEDLITPTCSACWTSSTGLSNIVMGLKGTKVEVLGGTICTSLVLVGLSCTLYFKQYSVVR